MAIILESKEEKESLLPLLPTSSTTSTTSNSKNNLQKPKYLVILLVILITVYFQFKSESNNVLSNYINHHRNNRHSYWKEFKSIRGYTNSYLDTKSSLTTESNLELEFLKIPNEESAREASHSYTAKVHIAGTEGDRLSALLVKSQWESLLNLPITSSETNIFEAGTKESREALMGKSSRRRHGCRSKGRMIRKLIWKVKHWFNRTLGGEVRTFNGKHDHHHHGKKEFEVKPRVWIDTYYPLLNYPISHSLTMTPVGSTTPSFVAKLLEDEVPEDITSAEGRFAAPTFHGLSKNGTAKGQLIYAGRGTKNEFNAMIAKGVDFNGKIVIVQYGGSFRGLKVGAAADAGAIGVLIYSDPIEDGEMTSENGYEVYPHGPARQPSSVQSGSVQFLSSYPGDPTTPFVPAYKNTTDRLPREDPTINIPSIPSFPISYEDALPLLKSLNGKGYKMEPTEEEKKRSGGKFKEGGLGYLGVEYWSGPGEELIEMSNIIDEKINPIWNTMAVIPGLLEDEVVVLGNHNDAWTFGAGDPNSGTASVHEIVKAFGVLLTQGWKPLRTIVLASWDAEEYGLIGSTEFGEDFGEWLKERVVAYINVDVSVSGTSYGISASPSLADLFKDVSSVIQDPDNVDRSLLTKMVTEGEVEGWEGQGDASNELHVGPLGSGSDFTVFLQHLGIASVNVGYSRKSTDPVYHYHSIYDSAYWMDNFGDKTFSRHIAVSKVLGLATLRLANSLVLPINLTTYSNELSYYSKKVHALVKSLEGCHGKDHLGLKKLDKAIEKVQISTSNLQIEIESINESLERLSTTSDSTSIQINQHDPHHNKKLHKLMKSIKSVNKRLREFESGFIDVEGLPGRKWYRSLVVAPGRDLGYGATTFPAITEAITLDSDLKHAAVEVKRLVKALHGIAEKLDKK